MRLFGKRLMRVSGQSMAPTLKPGALVVVDEHAYIRRCPAVGDLVAARPARLGGRAVIKRITAMAEGGYFLAGDNAAASTDSRSFGMVSRDEIAGQVSRSVWL